MTAKGSKLRMRKRRMQLSHQQDNKGSRNGRRRTYPKLYASYVEKWVISPHSCLRSRENKRILTQRMLQRKLIERMMMIAP